MSEPPLSAPDSSSEPLSLPGKTPGDVGVHTVLPEEAGWRLDLYLARLYPQYSRVLLRKAIQAGGVSIDGKGGKPAYRLKPGQRVSFTLPELPREAPVPEEIPLEVLYEDETLAVINKPADMVVHPSRGHWSGTLVSALAFKYDELSSVRGPERPGIVHRLDRDTSGVILIAKNNVSHARLADLFQTKKIHKEYFAIVSGVPSFDSDVVDLPIGHHPKNREKMMIARHDPEAKSAVTRFEVLERFRGFSTVRALPQTGRTHQIRVHLAHVGTPVLCDKLYGGFATLTLGEIAGKRGAPAKPRGEDADADFDAPILKRQALHARRLTFTHPETGKEITVEAPIPEDMQRTLEAIRKYR
ncbi:MAG: RluA family pseudouridine synthase [Thermoguttaceae bacterium]|nr:RluA family pseudouridine synthase [Thermoguttaceae bacterium]